MLPHPDCFLTQGEEQPCATIAATTADTMATLESTENNTDLPVTGWTVYL